MNSFEANYLFSLTSDGLDGAQPAAFVTVSKARLILAGGVFVVTFFVLQALAGGLFFWWQRLLWALALAVPAALRFHAGPAATAWIGRICFALCPPAAFLLVELLAGRNDLTGLSLLWVLLNLGFYYLIALTAWLITGRTKLSAGAALALFWAVGMVNSYGLRLCGSALTPDSLTALPAMAADIAALRPDAFQLNLTLAAVLALLVLASLPRQRERAPLCMSAFLAAFACTAFAVLFFATPALDYLDLYAGQTGGVLLHFAFGLRDMLVSRLTAVPAGGAAMMGQLLPGLPGNGL